MQGHWKLFRKFVLRCRLKGVYMFLTFDDVIMCFIWLLKNSVRRVKYHLTAFLVFFSYGGA